MYKYILISLLISSVGYAQTLQPGLWRAKTSIELNGIPLPSSEDEECISKEDTKDAKGTISKELKKRGCSVTKWQLKGKKLDAAVKCQKDDLEAQGTLTGTVTQKTYDLKGEAEGSFKSIPSSATITLTGKWQSACR